MKPSLIASNDQMLDLIEDLLNEGKTVRLKIKGNSMYPLLKDGLTQVDLSSPLDKEIKPGSLVLFKYGEGFILHRILKRQENQLLIRGDNLAQTVETAKTQDVIGIVRKIIYPSGRVIASDSFNWKIRSQTWLWLKPLVKFLLHLKNRLLINRDSKTDL